MTDRDAGRHVLWLLAGVLPLACVQERVRPPRTLDAWVESPGGTVQPPGELRGAPQATGPRELEGAAQETPVRPLRAEVVTEKLDVGTGPFHRFRWNVVRNPDGSLTKLYYLRADRPGATVYVHLMKRFIPGFSGLQEGQDYWVQPKFVVDPRQKNEDAWHQGSDFGLAFGAGDVADLLMVRAPEEMLEQIDRFLESVLTPVPQIEIEATIVEISLDDQLDTGVRFTFQPGTEENPKDLFFDSIVVDLAGDLMRGTFGNFSAIHDDNTINGLIQFLQATTNSTVLSAPKLAVLNGHRAIVDTGSQTPVLRPKASGTTVTVETQFKDTGIKVVIVPFLLGSDVVQLEISVEASAITGFVVAGVGSDLAVENPLITRRNAHTLVNVPSRRTVLIGGLTTTDHVDTVDKVPLLGDIPILGYLFRRSTVVRRHSQVLFLVKPTILRETLGPEVLFDPAAEGNG